MAPGARCPKCGTKVPAGSRFCQSCGTTVTGTPRWRLIVAGALILVLLGSLGLFLGMRRGDHAADQAHLAPAPEKAPAAVANTIDGAGPMPDWLTKANKAVIADYNWAASHHGELQYFPCFCGCYQSAGHVSNSECYYKRDKGGKITAYDAHAYG
ncbi:MAG TPA: PCYCGC motif-containing (lipo)protein [Symbiobacteriaceae bacterium]|nr:PCYCGC motif-containing (lipo)protein [Symbiobacteriaceae bacterium]